MACATNACLAEAIEVKDAFLAEPKPMLAKFHEANQRGEDHFLGWLFLLRDSAMLNPTFAPIEARLAMQKELISAAKPFENDTTYGEYADWVLSEMEGLAIAPEQESDAGPVPVTGSYAFELPQEAGSGGLKVTLADLETIRFALEVVAGPPAHNQGTMEGHAQLTAPNVFETKVTEYGGTCRLQFTFDGKAVEVKTLEGDPPSCGFGNNVVADQVYRMMSFDDPFFMPIQLKMAKNLEGDWRSTEDAKSELTIGEGLYVERYDGEKTGSYPYQYFSNCPALCDPAGSFPCIAIIGQDAVCYAVVKADGKILEISMVGGRGNTLSFKKK